MTTPTNSAAYLAECVKIEPTALEEEFIRIPADLSFWNQRYADTYQLWLECKLKRETLYATLYRDKKMDLENNAQPRTLASGKPGAFKAPSESAIDTEILLDDSYQNARAEEIAAESEKVRLWGIMDALRSKRDMLISIGAHQRAEMQADPSIRRDKNIDREMGQNHSRRGRTDD